MCMIFLHYYPAVSMAQCVSKLPLKNLLLAMGVSLWPVTQDTRHLGLRIQSPEKYQNLTLSDYLSAVLPGDMDAAKRLQEANLHHSHVAECYDFGKRNVIVVSDCFQSQLCSCGHSEAPSQTCSTSTSASSCREVPEACWDVCHTLQHGSTMINHIDLSEPL